MELNQEQDWKENFKSGVISFFKEASIDSSGERKLRKYFDEETIKRLKNEVTRVRIVGIVKGEFPKPKDQTLQKYHGMAQQVSPRDKLKHWESCEKETNRLLKSLLCEAKYSLPLMLSMIQGKDQLPYMGDSYSGTSKVILSEPILCLIDSLLLHKEEILKRKEELNQQIACKPKGGRYRYNTLRELTFSVLKELSKNNIQINAKQNGPFVTIMRVLLKSIEYPFNPQNKSDMKLLLNALSDWKKVKILC